MLGRIVTWREGSAFGWIASEALRTRGVFLHLNDVISGEPEIGKRVRFDLVDLGRGPRAVQAHVLREGDPDVPGDWAEPAYRVPEIEDYLARRARGQ
jgi:hypothetical protein